MGRLNGTEQRNAQRTKGPRTRRGPIGWRLLAQPLENQLDGKLHVESFAGADAGCAVEVSDGVVDPAKIARTARARGTDDRRPAAPAHGTGTGGKIDAVQEVERFHSQLELDALIDWDVLEH